MDDLDEIGLRRHHRVDVLVGHRRLVDHLGVLTALHALGRADVVLDGDKGLSTIAFPDAAKTGVVSVRRNDAGTAAVGYVIY